MGAALAAARENRRLNERAYQSQLVEVEDLVEAQVTESLMDALYLKVRYDHLVSRTELEITVGRELDKLVFGGA